MALWRAAGCGQQSKLTVVNVPYYVKFEAAGILRRVQLDVLHRVPREIRKVTAQAGFDRQEMRRSFRRSVWPDPKMCWVSGQSISARTTQYTYGTVDMYYTRVYLK